MDPVVQSAIIGAVATIVSVGGTVTVAIVGFRSSRSANRDTIATAQATNQATIEAAHADVQRTLDTTREGQIVDLYSRAIEQLGSDKLDVRIGGIYALERVALDSPKREHGTVMEVLAAFIREHSKEQWPPPEPDVEPGRLTRPDVQAALTVIGRRDSRYDRASIDLHNAILPDARLEHAILSGANLSDADLNHAFLDDADLSRTYCYGTIFTGAYLRRANLTGAILTSPYPNLAAVTSAFLDAATLTDADLTDARWPPAVMVPEGWKRDPDSGLLRRASTDPDNSGN